MEIREATPQDDLAVERVRLGTWKVAYRGLVPDAYLDALEPGERRTPPSTTTLIALAPEPAGMAAHGPCRDGEGRELYALYVLPAHWGTGLGDDLLAACGDVSSLWVLEHNARARAFYARHGFTPDGTAKAIDLGEPVSEIRMTRG